MRRARESGGHGRENGMARSGWRAGGGVRERARIVCGGVVEGRRSAHAAAWLARIGGGERDGMLACGDWGRALG